MSDKERAAAYKKQRDELLAFIKNAEVSSGVCCCGDNMVNHASPMICGHNPVDMWDHAVLCFEEDIAKFDKDQEARNEPQVR